ncbi:hypothetical protein GGQ54_002997 [Naumannella cuiyingiana]|uniref:DUF1499 domain-containing protein n=1 Tax=Naumannella cuiyingiana TaxID=1347891 RepID=A0A7Z0DBF1_9ACTN|nr:hypothetical protein [Naumannella cuiyingiana]NYI72437.1 hypothetical protein [Naumannella cuiyingiana]
MARRHSQSFVVSAPPEQVHRASFDAVADATGQPARLNGAQICGSTSVGLTSWGENLTVEVVPDARGARVSIESASALPTQFINFNHKKNVEKFARALGGRLGVPVEPA